MHIPLWRKLRLHVLGGDSQAMFMNHYHGKMLVKHTDMKWDKEVVTM